MMVKPNFILSMKSKNSRMGSGVGIYTRVCSVIKPGKPVILITGYSTKFIKSVLNYLKLKLNIKFELINKRN